MRPAARSRSRWRLERCHVGVLDVDGGLRRERIFERAGEGEFRPREGAGGGGIASGADRGREFGDGGGAGGGNRDAGLGHDVLEAR